jgi:ferredoxin
MALKASIDWDKCEGNGVCARVAPEIFSVDADGNSDVLMEEVPEDLRAKAMLAQRGCPKQAVIISEEYARRTGEAKRPAPGGPLRF